MVAAPYVLAHYAVRKQRRIGDEPVAALKRTFRISRHPFTVRPGDVRRALRGLVPEPVHAHYVVIDGRRGPPKQVIARLTGLPRSAFTTHHALRILRRLGFPAGRVVHDPQRRDPAPGGAQSSRRTLRAGAETLRPYVGQWVAIGDGEVLTAADSPALVIAWLSEHGRRADAMFRVPESEAAAAGVAPA
jgi:hypothetical protein